MKIAHIADIHWGLGYSGPTATARFDDICRTMDWVADRMIAEGCDIVIVAGDMFRKADIALEKASKEIRACTAWRRKLTTAGIEIFIISGTPSHDPISAYELLKDYQLPKVTIATEPIWYDHDGEYGFSLACIPGMDRSNFVSKDEYRGLPAHVVHQTMTDHINETCQQFLKESNYSPSILVGHFTYDLADTGFEDVLMQQEAILTTEAVRVQLEKVIELYSGLKNVDKKFLSELRHARTRLEKSADIRLAYLDEQAKENLMVSISKLRIMFMATPEAIQANKEMLQLKSTLPIDVEDFQDWYGFVIDHSCKTCTKADYKECAARRVLSKYDVVPVDPEAKEKCQYSYVSDLAPETTTPGLTEKPEFANLGEELEALQLRVSEYDRLKMVLNDILHPNGDGPANPSMCDITALIRSDWERFAKEAQELRKQIEDLQVKYDLLTESSGVAQESGPAEEDLDLDCEEDGLPVTLALNNGLKIVMHLPEHMTECLIAEIKRPSRFSRSICAKFVDDEFIAIDMQEVVAMRVSGLEDIEWSKPRSVQTQNTSTNEQERYRIECSCGAEYFANMYNGFPSGRTKGRCRECQSTVFADRQVDKIPDPSDGIGATLLTNRYFVIREPYQAREEDAPVSSPITPKSRELNVAPDLRNIKNIGREYKDPCRLLG